MFDKEQKEAFIKEYLKSKVVAKTSLYAVFRKTEPFEEKLNKDVSQFTRKEILDMFAQFRAKSVNSLLNYAIILKHYSRLMRGENEYESITKADVVDLIDKSGNILLSREELDDIEAQLLNWSDKAIVELLWEGISGKNMIDIYSISEECIQGDMLCVNGKEFYMTNRLKELLPKAFAETEIMSYGNTMRIVEVEGKGRLYKERANTRGVDSDDQKFRYFYRRIQIFREYLDIPGLTMKNLSASGMFYYIQLGIKETGLALREFLKTSKGKELAIQYGFAEDYYVDTIAQKYEQYI